MSGRAGKETFFLHDRGFYKTLFKMLLGVSLQNMAAYLVNMVDNIMLGHYGQIALSGAAAVNQIFFMVQMLAGAVGGGLVVIASQYWGRRMIWPMRALTASALRCAIYFGILVTVLCAVIPRPLLMIFTNDEAILAQGLAYLQILKWTFPIYMFTSVLYAALRSAGIVNISFVVSVISLVINVVINYTLIFGNFGFPQMGIIGAAVGTLIARCAECAIVVVYMVFFDRKLRFPFSHILRIDTELGRDFYKVMNPVLVSTMLWSVSVPLQTAILGHISNDAIAANSVASTFYQTLKVVVNAMASVSGVMIGNAIGEGDLPKIRAAGRSLSVIDLLVGLAMGILLFVLKNPLLSFYQLSDEAMRLSDHMIVIMCFVMVSMAYQMCVSSGIIQGGGDTKFAMMLNLISTWAVVMPLSFMAAFWWKLPVEGVVLAIQSDQFFKCVPVFIRFRSYRWIRKLTRE